jgi:hypothetical protein
MRLKFMILGMKISLVTTIHGSFVVLAINWPFLAVFEHNKSLIV